MFRSVGVLLRGRRGFDRGFCNVPHLVTIRLFSALPADASAEVVNTLKPKTKRKSLRDQNAEMHLNAGSGVIFSAEETLEQERNVFFSSNAVHVPSHEIEDLLRDNGLDFRASDDHFIVRLCPFCHPIKDVASNMYKLYVHRTKGLYCCHRCRARGQYSDLVRKLSKEVDLSSLPESSYSSSMTADAHGASVSTTSNLMAGSQPKNTSNSVYTGSANAIGSESLKLAHDQSVEDLFKNPKFVGALQYLQSVRGFNHDTIRAYRVGAKIHSFFEPKAGASPMDVKSMDRVEKHVFAFPWFGPPKMSELMDPKSSLVIRRLKIRSVDDKSKMALYPAGANWGLFGWHLIHKMVQNGDAVDSVVLTEGEFDAMAVYQSTGIPALSLPNGASSLPEECVDFLSPFSRIILWMDNDQAGVEGARRFAEKLGIERCFIVGFDDPKAPKDANDALRAKMDMKKMIDASKQLNHKAICSMRDLATSIRVQLANPEKLAGISFTSLPKFTQIIKGHRRGEVTIFSGPTGIGKTTILSQMSLDLSMQGVSTLWGSFEIPLSTFARKLLQQFAAAPIEAEQVPELIDQFESSVQMYFLRFFGSTKLQDVLTAMRFAIVRYDVGHVIIDNLQFMTSGQAMGVGKFDLQEKAIEEFRSFATRNNVHVTLVVHPRKEDDDLPLSLASVFGSAKATQEADNVVFIQRYKGDLYRFLDVKKNRFDGCVGSVPYRFEHETNRIYEMTNDEVQGVLGNSQMSDAGSSSPGLFKSGDSPRRFQKPTYKPSRS
ncbi:mitochondrial Twinkle helicase [Andalucia godoyi]|uniref:Mitochondrial Twinkle helicase n=1 Tax=Andalucia godoyi TaxID=505711 RepID=A0A8K0AI38_ANDGO|nr:mitochondrial Twinkle helicase [Andalucia godoyi]|eukprot:ANDGO_06345.mRNA.1 mitochondrial Twinkle helicase